LLHHNFFNKYFVRKKVNLTKRLNCNIFLLKKGVIDNFKNSKAIKNELKNNGTK